MSYKTINGSADAAFVEKKSEFIGYISHVKTNEQAVEFINSIKAMHRKATHNVYAYVLRDNNITRYSDDGEPQGTAGVPVLDAILKNNLTDVCVVVTRYFGGILLGGGGLVRAYSHSCKIAIDSADVINMCNCFEFKIITDYNHYGKINYIIPDYEIKILSTDFTDNVEIKLLVKSEFADKLYKEIINITSSKVEIEKSEEKFSDFS